MTRRHADPVEVLVRPGPRGPQPEQLLWRDRLYVVSDVLGHWVEAGGWWQGHAARAVLEELEPAAVGAVQELALAPIPSSPRWAQRAWGEPAPDIGASTAPTAVDDHEREVWRVEARAGRHGTGGVYDLTTDPASGRWWLTRVSD